MSLPCLVDCRALAPRLRLQLGSRHGGTLRRSRASLRRALCRQHRPPQGQGTRPPCRLLPRQVRVTALMSGGTDKVTCWGRLSRGQVGSVRFCRSPVRASLWALRTLLAQFTFPTIALSLPTTALSLPTIAGALIAQGSHPSAPVQSGGSIFDIEALAGCCAGSTEQRPEPSASVCGRLAGHVMLP